MDRWCSSCQRVVPLSDWAAHQRKHHDQASPRKGSTTEWRKVVARILNRDHHRCQHPGCYATSRLEVHHLDGNWKNNTDSNLETRCFDHNPRGRPKRH